MERILYVCVPHIAWCEWLSLLLIAAAFQYSLKFLQRHDRCTKGCHTFRMVANIQSYWHPWYILLGMPYYLMDQPFILRSLFLCHQSCMHSAPEDMGQDNFRWSLLQSKRPVSCWDHRQPHLGRSDPDNSSASYMVPANDFQTEDRNLTHLRYRIAVCDHSIKLDNIQFY